MNDWLGDELGIAPRRGCLAGSRELGHGDAREEQDRNKGTEAVHLDMLTHLTFNLTFVVLCCVLLPSVRVGANFVSASRNLITLYITNVVFDHICLYFRM